MNIKTKKYIKRCVNSGIFNINGEGIEIIGFTHHFEIDEVHQDIEIQDAKIMHSDELPSIPKYKEEKVVLTKVGFYDIDMSDETQLIKSLELE